VYRSLRLLADAANSSVVGSLVQLGELRRAGQLTPGSAVACPCVWREEASVVRAVSIAPYNRENSGYIEKYQSILSLFD
jgi:hypothetical protein